MGIVTQFDQITQLASASTTSAVSFPRLLSDDDDDAATACTSPPTAFNAWIGILNGRDVSTVGRVIRPLRFHASLQLYQHALAMFALPRLINNHRSGLTLKMLWRMEEFNGASLWSLEGGTIACNNQSKIMRATTRD